MVHTGNNDYSLRSSSLLSCTKKEHNDSSLTIMADAHDGLSRGKE